MNEPEKQRTGEPEIFKQELENRGRGEAETGPFPHRFSDSPMSRFPDSSFAGSPIPPSSKLQAPNPKPLRWLCLSVSVPYEAAEAVANFLVELGSTGVVEGSRDFQQPVKSTTEVQGFFPEETESAALLEALRRYLHDLAEIVPHLGAPQPHVSFVTSDAWQDRWREHFPPLEVGAGFLLLPPWEAPPAQTTRLVISIDPSMAFGTGHHATTQGCLEAIELLHHQYGPPNRALDLGTGSGILAIALAKLGAQHLWATDIDPIALTEAEKNSEANQVADDIQFSDLPIEHLPRPFSLVVANLFSSTLVAMAPTLGAAVASQGHAILSGIQSDQEQEVRVAYPAPEWRLVTRFPKEEWVTLVLQRT